MDERTLENLKGLHQSYWGKSSFADRLNALQNLEDYQARQQGRFPYEVKTFDEPDNRGMFVLNHDELEDAIYINRKQIADPGLHYDTINTVLHEGRHAYQHFSYDRGTHHDPFEEERWAINSPNYVSTNEDYVKYFFQPMERDAHYFSREEMNRLFSVLESEFGRSEHFDTYATLLDRQLQSMEKRAEERWGKNYIQEVDKAIGIDEVQIRENLIEAGRIEPEREGTLISKEPMPEPTAEKLFWEIRAEWDYRNEKGLENADPKKPYIPISFTEVMNERLDELGYQPGTASYDQFVEEIEYERREVEIGYEEVDHMEEYTDKKYAQAWERLIERGRIEPETNVVIEATLRNGAYVRPSDDRTNLGYVPFTKDENGYNRIDVNKIEWNENPEINLSVEKDGRGAAYIKLDHKHEDFQAKSYLRSEAKPFRDLNWEVQERTFERNRETDREYTRERDRGMER